MTTRSVAFEDIRGQGLEGILREVVTQREILTVRLPDGEAVTIQPLPPLEPLPELEGFVEEGWKDAIYE